MRWIRFLVHNFTYLCLVLLGFQVKDEAWWLILGNVVNSELYAMKRISFTNHLVTQMELPKISLDPQVKIPLFHGVSFF
jgi:hypothetical protein